MDEVYEHGEYFTERELFVTLAVIPLVGFQSNPYLSDVGCDCMPELSIDQSLQLLP